MRYFDSTGPWLLGFAVASIVLHGAVDGAWGFHRDELLYLAMGDHPALGYWSNPPVIGFLGLIADIVPGTGIWTVRWIPALLGALLVVVTGLIAREIGGGLPGIIMACLCTLLSPALLRTGVLFQPVIVDVLIWTIILLLGLRHLNTSNERWLVAVGLVVGVGLMNKYSVAFLILGMVTGLLLTPHRRVFRTRAFYMGLAVASVVVLPNLIWQIAHGFPVIEHFGVLRSTQLVNVKPHDFILEQFLIHLPVVWVWVVGLVFLFRPVGREYRVVGWTCVAVFFLLLVLGGKSYYTLGLYPALFAAGARWLELRARRYLQVGLFGLAVILAVSISPFSIPYLSVQEMVAYGRAFVDRTGIDAPLRWEDGRVRDLPQDYADMLGWEELAGLAMQGYQAAAEPDRAIIYAENYGQAGAIARFAPHLPEPISFSDSYRLWLPATLPRGVNTLIYVNDELGVDVDSLFADIRLIGTVETPYARERGTGVYLCENPQRDFREFWGERVASIRR